MTSIYGNKTNPVRQLYTRRDPYESFKRRYQMACAEYDDEFDEDKCRRAYEDDRREQEERRQEQERREQAMPVVERIVVPIRSPEAEPTAEATATPATEPEKSSTKTSTKKGRGLTPLDRWQKELIRNSPEGKTAGYLAALLVLASHADGNGKGAFPGYATLRREAAVSSNTIKAAFKWAKKHGMLDWEDVHDSKGRLLRRNYTFLFGWIKQYPVAQQGTEQDD